MSRKAPDAPKAENHERWIVSYADMVTLLFALFVVLYALSDSNPRKLLLVQQSLDRAFSVGVLNGNSGNSAVFENAGGLTPAIGEIKTRNMITISQTLGDFTKAAHLENKVQVRQTADSITISLADNLLFSSGSAELKPGSQEVLAEIAAVLRELPNNVRIEGHTDNVPVNSGDFPTNWELSGARATTVLRFLAEGAGMPVTRLTFGGYADTRPLGDNATAEGRALNRRADIVILYPTQEDLQRALAPAEKKKP